MSGHIKTLDYKDKVGLLCIQLWITLANIHVYCLMFFTVECTISRLYPLIIFFAENVIYIL